MASTDLNRIRPNNKRYCKDVLEPLTQDEAIRAPCRNREQPGDSEKNNQDDTEDENGEEHEPEFAPAGATRKRERARFDIYFNRPFRLAAARPSRNRRLAGAPQVRLPVKLATAIGTWIATQRNRMPAGLASAFAVESTDRIGRMPPHRSSLLQYGHGLLPIGMVRSQHSWGLTRRWRKAHSDPGSRHPCRNLDKGIPIPPPSDLQSVPFRSAGI